MQQQLDRFQRDGFLLVENFFPGPLMDALHRLAREHFGEDPGFEHSSAFLQKSQTDVIPWFPQRDGPSAFDRIEDDADFVKLTRLLLGDGWQRQYCMVMFSKRRSMGQAWHQDCVPDDPKAFNLNRLVYTRDLNEETGGQVVVVPGSHKRGLLPPGDPTEALDGAITLTPRKGSLMFLHGHAWHRVLPIADTPRVSINYRAAPEGVNEGITDVGVYRNMLYRFSTSEILSERNQRSK